MDELISVIVPVYKVENFLSHCITSILNQTYTNLEIILVDDGSPDRCPEICDAFMNKDKRIKVIHQNNGGGGKARNRALDIAEGDFIAFVDSDDYIASEMFEFLHKQFSDEVDIVECSYQITENDDVIFDSIDDNCIIKLYTAEQAMRENIRDHIFRQLIWNKLYRRHVIDNIRFPEGKKIDDEFWTYQVLGNARRLKYTDKVLYAYRQQKDSIMHSLNAEKRFQAIQAKIQRHMYICERMPKLMSESICDVWRTCIYQGQLAIRSLDESECEKISEQLKQTLQQYPLKGRMKEIPVKQKIWLVFASISFEKTCKIRNWMKIGM